MMKGVRWSRLVPYWATVIAATWILAINIGWNTEMGYEALIQMTDPVRLLLGVEIPLQIANRLNVCVRFNSLL
jgi:hypothetical protein